MRYLNFRHCLHFADLLDDFLNFCIHVGRHMHFVSTRWLFLNLAAHPLAPVPEGCPVEPIFGFISLLLK